MRTRARAERADSVRHGNWRTSVARNRALIRLFLGRCGLGQPQYVNVTMRSPPTDSIRYAERGARRSRDPAGWIRERAAAWTTLEGRCPPPLGCRLWARPRASRPPWLGRVPRGAARSPSPRDAGPRLRSRAAQPSPRRSERGAGPAAPYTSRTTGIRRRDPSG